jgi:outer membrane protein assembly factor BamE (lipoprotein component of BamABCDE complex)
MWSKCVKGIFARSIAVILLCGALFSGCATTYQYSYPGHKTFTHDNVALIRVGMSAEQVKSIFGEPDEQYTAPFGSDVGDEWNGRVWIYFTQRDPRLQHVKRYKKNVFVFYPPDGEMKLNHWDIED